MDWGDGGTREGGRSPGGKGSLASKTLGCSFLPLSRHEHLDWKSARTKAVGTARLLGRSGRDAGYERAAGRYTPQSRSECTVCALGEAPGPASPAHAQVPGARRAPRHDARPSPRRQVPWPRCPKYRSQTQAPVTLLHPPAPTVTHTSRSPSHTPTSGQGSRAFLAEATL